MRTEYRAHIRIDDVYLEHAEPTREGAMRWLSDQSNRAAEYGLTVHGMGLSAPRYFSDITGLEIRKYDEKDLLSWAAQEKAQSASL